LSGGGNGAPVSQSVKDSLRAEKRKAIMIGLTGMNFLLGHISYLVLAIMFRFFPKVVNADINSWYCYSAAAVTIYYASFVTPFLFYYFFNKHFKRFMIKNLMTAVSPFAGLLGIRIAQEGEQTQTERRTTMRTNVAQ
jgi:hypothetical protein